jgi:predicted TIM-barrel fold metal-dependent hydrolase
LTATIGALPQGACDCHCHVFGPAARFSYSPDDAPPEAYLALLDRLSFDRGVLVQPSAYGRDNRAMLDALTSAPARLRGVAVGGAELTIAILKQWHAASVRGLRANEFRRAGRSSSVEGVSRLDETQKPTSDPRRQSSTAIRFARYLT